MRVRVAEMESICIVFNLVMMIGVRSLVVKDSVTGEAMLTSVMRVGR